MYSTSFHTITEPDFASLTIERVYVAMELEKLKLVCSLSQKRNKVSKRIVDILISSLVSLLVLSWFIPLVALAIKITSGGNIFFIQPRTGYKGKTFLCIKLCSMYPNSAAHLVQAQKNDSRVTPVGKFLRKFSLDELPQFINVLLGNMSVVGPRPHMLKHTEEYAAKHNLYELRHIVKPGITGLSQVKGYRGEIVSSSSLRNRITLDIFYIKKWSTSLDFYIMLKTIKLLLLGDKHAY